MASVPSLAALAVLPETDVHVSLPASRKRPRETVPLGDAATSACAPPAFWPRRHALWSLFSRGVVMDSEGWYSVTPEAVALDQARRMLASLPPPSRPSSCVMDAFTGVGGNAIALARVLIENGVTAACVLAVDISEERLRMAAHNAGVYAVSDRIVFLIADAVRVLHAAAEAATTSTGGATHVLCQQLEHGVVRDVCLTAHAEGEGVVTLQLRDRGGVEADAAWMRLHGVFLSPPWGGLTYPRHRPFCVCVDVRVPCSSVAAVSHACVGHVCGAGAEAEASPADVMCGVHMLHAAVLAAPCVQLFLPRSTSRRCMAGVLPLSCSGNVIVHWVEGHRSAAGVTLEVGRDGVDVSGAVEEDSSAAGSKRRWHHAELQGTPAMPLVEYASSDGEQGDDE